MAFGTIGSTSLRPMAMARGIAAKSAAFLTLLAAAVAPAHAAYTINIQQVGGDVVATGNGSFDLTAFSYHHSTFSGNAIQPGVGILIGAADMADVYFGAVFGAPPGQADFGSGPEVLPNSATGPLVAFIDSSAFGILGLPAGYVSGSVLSTSTMTFNGATFTSLGLTAGTYIYTWGSGTNADSLTLNVGAAGAVPEPAGWAMLILGFGLVGATMRRRATVQYDPALFALSGSVCTTRRT